MIDERENDINKFPSKKRKLDGDDDNNEEENETDRILEDEKNDDIRKTCYCGKLAPMKQNRVFINNKNKLSLDLSTRTLKCKLCSRWVHMNCLKTKLEEVPLSGDYCYLYMCTDCSNIPNMDSFTLTTKKWSDVSVIALYNVWLNYMISNHNGDIISGKKERECYFRIHDVIDYIDKNWKILCTGRDRTKTWGATINSTISTRAGDNGGFYKGSTELDLELGYWSLSSYVDLPEPYKDYVLQQTPNSKNKSGKGSKSAYKSSGKKKPKTLEEGNDEISRFRSRYANVSNGENEEERDWYWFPRNYDPLYFESLYSTKQVMCVENSAKNIKIEGEGKIISNDGGYRVSRSSHGISEGTCYFEIKILPSEKEAVVRVGFSMRFGDIESPLGVDSFSYSYHNKSGKKFHKSWGMNYGEKFSEGDIIGCLIHLPANPEKNLPVGLIVSQQSRDDIAKRLVVNEGSRICYYKNGVFLGDAFININHGLYYPSVSIFTGSVSVAFGPPDTVYSPSSQFETFKYASEVITPLSSYNIGNSSFGGNNINSNSSNNNTTFQLSFSNSPPSNPYSLGIDNPNPHFSFPNNNNNNSNENQHNTNNYPFKNVDPNSLCPATFTSIVNSNKINTNNTNNSNPNEITFSSVMSSHNIPANPNSHLDNLTSNINNNINNNNNNINNPNNYFPNPTFFTNDDYSSDTNNININNNINNNNEVPNPSSLLNFNDNFDQFDNQPQIKQEDNNINAPIDPNNSISQNIQNSSDKTNIKMDDFIFSDDIYENVNFNDF